MRRRRRRGGQTGAPQFRRTDHPGALLEASPYRARAPRRHPSSARRGMIRVNIYLPTTRTLKLSGRNVARLWPVVAGGPGSAVGK